MKGWETEIFGGGSMSKVEMRETLATCAARRQVCNAYFKYEYHCWNLIPLTVGEKLFLSAEEDDFILDGFTVRRFRDLTDVKAKDDMCGEILRQEGIIDALTIPAVSTASWESVFSDLQRLGENVIVESESRSDDESGFVIGRIEKVCRRSVFVRHFDADGIWQESSISIAYVDITSVTFDSRYVRVFSKYLSAPPQSAGPRSMNVWTNLNWEKSQSFEGARTGLRVVCDSTIDAEVRRACKDFCHWLRSEYLFPVRVPVYVKANQKLRTMDGDTAYGTFFRPEDRHIEPYIRVAAGDYAEMVEKWGQDDALGAILETIAHELTHYFQWLNNLRLTPKGEERQAVTYANRILGDYAAIREKP